MSKKNDKKQKQKDQIMTLADQAKLLIGQNQYLQERINNYNKQIQMIKNFMNKISDKNKITENKTKDKNNINYIKEEYTKFYSELKQSILKQKESKKKIFQKYESFKDKYLDDISGSKNIKEDAFILSYSLESKLNVIKKLKENIHSSRDYNIFREPKRETLVSNRIGEDYIDDNNQECQRYALYEFRQFNKYNNKCRKRLKIIKGNKDKIASLNNIIDYFNQKIRGVNDKYKINSIKSSDHINYKSNKIFGNHGIFKKNFSEKEINYNMTDVNFINKDTNMLEEEQTFNFGKIDKNLFNKRKEQKKSKKLKFQTMDELFDPTNNEGEKEAIIDDELHSDEDLIFEKKIKPKKRIISDYKPQIEKIIPNLYFSQIEFNKSKLMNEADLYSYQRRKLQTQNMDENIKIFKTKIKTLKRRCKIYEIKMETLINFIKNLEDDYNRLKSIKIPMTIQQNDLNFMKKEFLNRNTKDVIDEEDEINYQKELDDYLNDPDLNDPYFVQNTQSDISHRQIIKSSNMIKQIKNENINNDDKHKKKKYDNKTTRYNKKEKVHRLNSK